MKTLAHCQLCSKKYSEGVPRLDETSVKRTERVVNELAKHIQETHPDYWQQCVQNGMLHASFAALGLFNMPNTSWTAQFREGLRLRFAAGFRNLHIDDAKIAEMVGKLELPPEYFERVIASHTALRNVLEEIPPPTPGAQEQPAAVPAVP